MRRAARVDKNQSHIVNGLRKYGASVLIVSQLKNCFDILAGYKGVNFIMEIKDPEQPPSKRKLTDGELKFKQDWKGGEYYIVETLKQAIQIINGKH